MSKDKLNFEFDWISKYRNGIYGITILWIVFFHADIIMGLKYKGALDYIFQFGNMGCELFLLCSGISLYFAFSKSSDIKLFYKRRIIRLIIPTYITCLIYWIASFPPLSILSKLSLLDFWITGNQQIWFVSVILICYLIYPLIYFLMFKINDKLSFWVMLILIGIFIGAAYLMRATIPDRYNLIEIGFLRFPVFIVGCFLGKIVFEKKKLGPWIYVVSLIVFLVSYYYLDNVKMEKIEFRLLYLPAGLALLILLTAIMKLIPFNLFHKVLSWFGKISINLYLSHVLLSRLYKISPWKGHISFKRYFVIVILSILMAYITYYLGELLLKFIEKIKAKKKIEK